LSLAATSSKHRFSIGYRRRVQWQRTRRSLLYPAAYLTGSGLGLALAPTWTLRMLGSNGHYDPVMVQFAAVFILGLAVLVIQTFRLGLDVLYPTLIAVRVGFCACYVALFADTRDPFFLVVLGVVAAGLIASSITYAIDRRRAR
jgi:hypothetical protein